MGNLKEINKDDNVTSVMKAQPQEEKKIVTNSSSPTNVNDIKINTINIDANQEITAKKYVEKEKYKVSGTVKDEELKTNKIEKKEEVLDEHTIKRDVQMSNAEFKKKLIYIAVFVGVIFLFMLFMPIIFKIFAI